MNQHELSKELPALCPLFADFPPDRLLEILQGSRVLSFEPDEAIIEFGEQGHFLGVLLHGHAEVSVADDSGARHRLQLLQPGALFGEMAMMTGEPTNADVIAVGRCRVLLIPQALFSTVLATHPSAIRHLSKMIQQRSIEAGYREKDREGAAAARRAGSDPYGLSLEAEQPMKVLVINTGSSSLKYNLFDTADRSRDARGSVESIGEQRPMRHSYTSAKGKLQQQLAPGTHREAFSAMEKALTDAEQGVLGSWGEISAIGHRVVHGGERFQSAVLIDGAVVAEIERLSGLAPLHNPVNLIGITEARTRFPHLPQVAVFDTAFHHTLPPYAYLYALPYEYYERDRVRRYGFHGTSHLYVSLRAAQLLGRSFNELEIVSCHLGNGASVCAVDHGRSVDTSMGLTPAEGLVMGTRCGDVDPGALAHVMRLGNLDAEAVSDLINRKSGLRGISGFSNDMREIESRADEGDHRALLALKSFCYRVRKYIGAYGAAMGGLDAIVFTGGIGQNSAGVRALACQGLGYMGVQIDEAKNQAARGLDEPRDVSAEGSRIRVLVVPTDEELMIARETVRAMGRQYISKIIANQREIPVPIEVSAHHVHLSQAHVEALFGEGHQLTPQNDLSQPGQFTCQEKVTLVGPKGRVERVRVLGPVRKQTQVEIAMTEQFKLGIHPPVRESGDLANTPGLKLEGTAGSVQIDEGVICAMRHIHMSPEDALSFGLRDRNVVRVRIEGDRELVFGDVLVRVHPCYRLAMHVDTDEGNAADITSSSIGHIDAIQSQG